MKIIYKKTITEQIIDAKMEAKKKGKEIDVIELSSSEWSRLRREQNFRFNHHRSASLPLQVCGVSCVVIDPNGVGF